MIKFLGVGGAVAAASVGAVQPWFLLAIVATLALCVLLLVATYVVAMFAPHRQHVLGVLDRLVELVEAIRGGSARGKGS